jgi:hypothetical protein
VADPGNDEIPRSYEPTERRTGGPDDPTPDTTGVREEDLEPHAGLRYIARLFKVLSLLLIILLVAEIVMNLARQGTAAIPILMVEATRLIVSAALLWAGADIALMLIESNHDLRATRILVGRLNGKVQRMEQAAGLHPPRFAAGSGQGAPPAPPREGPPGTPQG